MKLSPISMNYSSEINQDEQIIIKKILEELSATNTIWIV